MIDVFGFLILFLAMMKVCRPDLAQTRFDFIVRGGASVLAAFVLAVCFALGRVALCHVWRATC